MLKSSHRAAAFAVLACVCLVAACDDAPTEAPKPAASVNQVPSSKVAAISPDMVAAVSAGRDATAISVHFALRASPVANQALPVDVAIVPHRKFSVVLVHFESHDGLSTTVGEEFGPAANVDGESALTHQLVLLPSREGMFMVTASVETEGEDGNVTRVFSIPVIVAAAPGPVPAAAPPATPTSTDAPASAPPGN